MGKIKKIMSDLNLSWTPIFGQIYTWIAMDKFGHLAFMVNNNWGNIPKVILAHRLSHFASPSFGYAQW